ncbi:SPOR domain-containing protein [Prevotella corporis]|uniref:SPOR domain-containing protein n=1 Tax=Prevotella corporis TaxID=28128 RepID=UPI00041B715C|nr:SPOR domain-containing protein [Prevotella corporis]
MKKFLTTLVIVLLGTLAASAQGTVTVTQSAEIDALVNGNKKAKTKAELKAEKKAAKMAAKEHRRNGNLIKPSANVTKTQAPIPPTRQETKVAPVPRPIEPRVATPSQGSTGSQYSPTYRTKLVRKKVKKSTVDPVDGAVVTNTVTKRIIRGAKKMRGFRVLAYSGGNTRVARQEAERLGQKAKALFPTEPIYVHFYSPRWMCQIGNFTSYNKARNVMRKLRKEGFSNANVIRTMITVQTTKFVDEELPTMDE